MQQRPLGRTGRTVSAIGLGTWQLGADWGDGQRERRARGARGIRRSRCDALRHRRRLRRRAQRVDHRAASSPSVPGHDIVVATKMGRRLAQEPENYSPENFRAWTDRSRANLGVDTLDLVQLHCPPTAGHRGRRDLRRARRARRRRHDRARTASRSRRRDQALAAIARPNVTNVQIILNPFRLKPLDEVLPAAENAGVVDLRARPARFGAAVGQVLVVDDVRRQRPPRLQPSRRGLRSRRDVLGGRLRSGAGCCRRARGRASRRRLAARRQPRVDRVARRA